MNVENKYNNKLERGGVHTARTMMLAELRALLSFVDAADAARADYLEAIQTANCLGKRSGKTHPKVVTIEVTRKGRRNLHKFNAALQAQLEGYLVSLGILQKGQTLNPQETPPSEDVHDLQPAFKH